MMTRWMFVLVATLGLLAGCGGKEKSPEDTGPRAEDTSTQPGDVLDAADRTEDIQGTELPGSEVWQDVTEVDAEPQLPEWYELPFVIERAGQGEPITPEEVTAFTKAITGFYKDVGYFDWIWWTAHGLDDSYDPDMMGYKLYWQDTQAYREGDTVRFVHTGGADNLMIRTSKVMNNAIAGYLMTGDMAFGRIVRDYAKGVAALSKGFEWESEEPLVKYLQARAVFTHDHDYETDGGRKVRVEYGPVKQKEVYSWNAHTLPNDENPEYGAIWVRTMRSKDDVPHMFRMVPLLRRVAADGADADVREAAALAVEYLEGFARDIVDQGYYIRTKDKEGTTFIPLTETGVVNDLASFVNYDGIIPDGECNAKLSAALVAYHDEQGLACGAGDYTLYEDIATNVHFFNLAIIRYFHLSALTNAIAGERWDVAEEMLYGVVKRADRYMSGEDPLVDDAAWDSELAGWLLAASAGGLPLTADEARVIMAEYTASAENYRLYEHWDPWADGMADGPFDYKPPRDGNVEPGNPESGPRKFVRLPEMSYILEYCYSPWRSPYGAPLLDCDIVRDPSRWGE